jgi:hypothetical protein
MGNSVGVLFNNSDNYIRNTNQLIDDKSMIIETDKYIFKGYYKNKKKINNIDYDKNYVIEYKNKNSIKCNIEQFGIKNYLIKIENIEHNINSSNLLCIDMINNGNITHILNGCIIYNDMIYKGKIRLEFKEGQLKSILKIEGIEKDSNNKIIREMTNYTEYVIAKDTNINFSKIVHNNGDIYEGETAQILYKIVPHGRGIYKQNDGIEINGIFMYGKYMSETSIFNN